MPYEPAVQTASKRKRKKKMKRERNKKRGERNDQIPPAGGSQRDDSDLTYIFTSSGIGLPASASSSVALLRTPRVRYAQAL